MSEIVKSKLSTDKPLNPHNANENKKRNKVYDDLVSSRVHDDKSDLNDDPSQEKLLTLRSNTQREYEDDEKSVQLLFTEQKEKVVNTYDTPIKHDSYIKANEDQISYLIKEKSPERNESRNLKENDNFININNTECADLDILNTIESKGKMSFQEISEELKNDFSNPMASYDESQLPKDQIIGNSKPFDTSMSHKFETISYGSDSSENDLETSERNIENISQNSTINVNISNSISKKDSVKFKSKAMQNVYQSHKSFKMNKNEEIIPKHISIINKAKIRNNSKSIESRNKENEINISKGKSVSKDIENFVDLNQEKEKTIEHSLEQTNEECLNVVFDNQKFGISKKPDISNEDIEGTPLSVVNAFFKQIKEQQI